MCGICGTAGFEDESLLKRMCSVMHHRGPDQSGKYIDSGICLGHQRLSIIDVKGGRQPIHNEDDSIWVVYNGETYNNQILKDELESKGHDFYTSSDTEVLVHLYEEYGINMVHHLRGMFAFALWDSNKEILHLARDRLGIKPLYYTLINGKLLFASEIKALLQSDEVRAKVNISALHDYLTFRHTLNNETLFSGIKKLKPGNLMTYSQGSISINEYWDLPLKSETEDRPEEYYIKKTYDLLEESVKMRLMSEVPLGVYLSGGIDSGIITAMMSKIVDEPVETFSVGFGNEGEIGELTQAQKTANYLGTNHHQILIEQGEYKNNLENIVWHNEEPVADPSALAIYLLSKKAKEKVTVVLNGAGGDEVFGGYINYKVGLLNEKYHRYTPKALRRGFVRPIVNKVSPHLPSKYYVGLKSVTDENKEHGFLFTKSVFSEDNKNKLYTEDIKSKTNSNSFEKATHELFDQTKGHNFLNRMMYADTKSYLVNHILLETDKLTMSSSIEARVPIIDHKIIDFAATIPQKMKLKGNNEKYILKKVGQDLLPHTKKMRKKPFRTPIDTWFKDELYEMAEQSLDDSIIKEQGFFKPETVNKIIKKHDNSELLYNHQLYALLMFETWYEKFIG